MRTFVVGLIILYSTITFGQTQSSLISEKTVLLAHPTVSTLKVIHTLHHKGLVNLSEYNLIGVYHELETYDYSQSESIIDTISGINIRLIELKDSVHADSIFIQNHLTATFKRLFEESDGIFFFGGPDIPPALYNEKTHPRTLISDTYRHYWEASFLFHLLGGYQNPEWEAWLEQRPDYIIHGICLGLQTMNVATGGTLIQDIPSEIYSLSETNGLKQLDTDQIHRNYYPHQFPKYKSQLNGSCFHKIKLKGYFLVDLLNIATDITPEVNSYHHQAIEKIGKGFKVSASSADELIIEGIYHSSYPNVFGVQFHPERTGFFKEESGYRMAPSDKTKQLYECIDDESMEFHIQYWQAINRLLNEPL